MERTGLEPVTPGLQSMTLVRTMREPGIPDAP